MDRRSSGAGAFVRSIYVVPPKYPNHIMARRRLWSCTVVPLLAFVFYWVFVRPQPRSALAANAVDVPQAVFARRPWYYEAESPGRPSSPPGSISLAGRVAIVTGSSLGIGRALAAELYRRGCHVVVTSRSQKRSSAAVAAIQQRYAVTK